MPDNLVRYPFSHHAFLPFTVFAAACHLLMLIGVVYLARGGLAGDSRTGRIGLGCVIAGLALLFVCEWAQLPFVDQHTSNTGPSIVDAGFGLATLLLAGGMIAVGVATLRQPTWGSWRQYAPLICGLLSLVVIPIQFTEVLWLGITVFCARLRAAGRGGHQRRRPPHRPRDPDCVKPVPSAGRSPLAAGRRLVHSRHRRVGRRPARELEPQHRPHDETPARLQLCFDPSQQRAG